MTNSQTLWTDEYREVIFREAKSLLRDALNCSQIPTHEKIIQQALLQMGMHGITGLGPKEVYEWLDNILHLHYLDPLSQLEDLEEAIFHSEKQVQVFRNSQSPYLTCLNLSPEDYLLSLQALCIRQGITWNYSSPFASFTLEQNDQKFRATLIHSSIHRNGTPKLFLRKIKGQLFPLSSYCETASLPDILERMVSEKSNILIAGATGSGKTGLLSSMLGMISPLEHIVALEDTDELISNGPTFTKLLSSNQKNKSLNDYMTYAMRMRPDRIILGEMRSQEVIPFILATNTGHRGLMATVHANSAKDSIERVATLFAIYGQSVDVAHRHILKMIGQNIDYVIFLKNKKIHEIIRPLGSEGEHILYTEEYYLDNSDQAHL